MKFAYVIFAVLVLALCSLGTAEAKAGGACAGCTLAVSLIEQLAIYKRQPVSNVISTLCKYLANKDSTIELVCNLAAGSMAPAIQADLNKGVIPEISCQTSFKMCTDFPTCRLFKRWPPPPVTTQHLASYFASDAFDYSHSAEEVLRSKKAFSEPSVVTRVLERAAQAFAERLGLSARELTTSASLKKALNLAASDLELPVIDHLPLSDDDKDRFSQIPTLRGTDWRGKDCDDKNANVYPGRKAAAGSADVDHNCNGIKGTSPTGKSYEDLYCAGTKQYGLIALGDSATAHFSLPPAWLNANTIADGTYANLFDVVSNEVDYPMCSSTTGHGDPARCPAVANYTMTSLYMKLRERNRCVHRDYQNIGVNGARSGSMMPSDKGDGIITTMQRSQGGDQPALVMYALIGNDVCGSSSEVSDMTPVAEFTQNTINSLNYLDTVLPAGSHVVMGGLVDGRVLFDSMSSKTHPIGTGYPELYDYLNCLKTSPCSGWMNTNATVRDATTQHASLLSDAYPKIVASQGWKNFKAYFVPTMQLMNQVVTEYVKSGKDAADLIEKTDGFHPSTLAQRMLADHTWSYMTTTLGIDIPVNPNNAEIERVFGDQGGY